MKRIQEENRIPLVPNLPLDTPFVINVDPSSVCNFKCKFCYHSQEHRMDKQGVMPWETYEEVIKNIKEFSSKLKTLRLYAYGEPLLNKRFADMVKLGADSNIAEQIDTTTNGSFLNPQLKE